MNPLKKIVYKSLYIPMVGLYISKLLDRRIKPYKKVFFVASTGRSGTGTLYEIFHRLNNVRSFHEPVPLMHDRLMAEKNNEDATRANKTYRRVKSTMMKLDNVGYNCDYYFESNHMFIKSFIDYAVKEFGEKMEIIHLYRDPVLVAKSMYELDTIPGATRLGNKWYLDYRASGNLLQMQEALENDLTHGFYKCLWYYYELEERVKFYKQKYPQIRFHDIATEDLNDKAKVMGLLDALEIEYDEAALNEIVGHKTNTKGSSKVNTLSLEEATAMHETFLKTLQETFGEK